MQSLAGIARYIEAAQVWIRISPRFVFLFFLKGSPVFAIGIEDDETSVSDLRIFDYGLDNGRNRAGLS